ncbi:MAG: hypothetical protein WCC93_10990, partial [Chthoniobacterales bacterium]
MKQIPTFLLLALAIFPAGAPGQEAKSTATPNATLEQPRVVELKTPDGTMLKGSYFGAAKPGPGVLLFHQSNRPRQS